MSIEIQLPGPDADHVFYALFSGEVSPEHVRTFYQDVSRHFDSWDGKRVLGSVASISPKSTEWLSSL